MCARVCTLLLQVSGVQSESTCNQDAFANSMYECTRRMAVCSLEFRQCCPSVAKCEQCGPGFALVELIEHAEARATHSHHS